MSDIYESSQILPIEFKDFARAHGINLDYPDDWIDWFDCWEAGHKVGQSKRSNKDYNRGYKDATNRAIALIEGDRDG